MPEAIQSPDRKEVWRMFDKIAPRYDFLNRLLSMRQDVRWRKKMAKYLVSKPDQKLLDLATGTGDQILHLLQKTDRITTAIGIDMSTQMLAVGQQKVAASPFQHCIDLKEGDATAIPLSDNQFDVVTITFGIRNVIDVNQSLNEMFRVLATGGRVLILEFSLPASSILKALYLFYFRKILPILGGWISGDSHAYRYLNETVETFPYGSAFCNLMTRAGFENVSAHPLTFGIATIYQVDKLGK